MNWTEGNLARHSRRRRGKDLAARQKEHFAKVRSGELNYDRPQHGTQIRIPPHILEYEAQKAVSLGGKGGQVQDARATVGHNHVQNATVAGRGHSRGPSARPDAASDRASEMRRKLLMMPDWTAVGLQKPLRINSLRARATRVRGRQPLREESPPKFQNVGGTGHDIWLARKQARSGPEARRDDIRVRIGSQEMKFGASSNTSRHYLSDRRAAVSDDRRAPTRSRYFHSSSSPRSQQSSRPVETSSGAPESSSSLSHIFQPTPRRPHRSVAPLLRSQSFDSEIGHSTLAQVGGRQPIVSPALREENDRWRTYVCQSDWSCPGGSPGAHGHLSEPRFSPRISQLAPCTRTNNKGRWEETRVPAVAHGAASSGNSLGFSPSRAAADGDLAPSSTGSALLQELYELDDLARSEPSFAKFSDNTGPSMEVVVGSTVKNSNREGVDTEQHQATKPSGFGDDAEWLEFILSDDGDRTEDIALHEAKREAALALQGSARTKQTMAAWGQEHDSQPPSDLISTADACLSHDATGGSICTNGRSDEGFSVTPSGDHLGFKHTAGEGDLQEGIPLTPGRSGGAAIPSSSATTSIPDSVAVEPSRSPITAGEPKATFKCSVSKPAVDKFLVRKHSSIPPTMPPPKRQRRGRRRGGRMNGGPPRAGIRDIPSHDSDPIEEFMEEDVDLIRCPESPPLFASLDVEFA